MEGSGDVSSSSLTQLSGVSTGGTLHDEPTIIPFYGEEIDAVLTVAVETLQRSGISVTGLYILTTFEE